MCFARCFSGGADGGEEPDAGREGGDGRVGHQLRRPLHLVNGRLHPRRIRRLAVRSRSLICCLVVGLRLLGCSFCRCCFAVVGDAVLFCLDAGAQADG